MVQIHLPPFIEVMDKQLMIITITYLTICVIVAANMIIKRLDTIAELLKENKKDGQNGNN